MIDLVSTLRERLNGCGCQRSSRSNCPPCGGCIHDLRTLNEINRLRQSLKDISANSFDEPLSASYAQDALDGEPNA
jgi:hypothetical protein